VQRNHASDATWCRETALRHVVQRDRTTLRRAEEPRDTTRYRETAQCHVVQRDRATSRRTEGLLDATCCGETARCHVVQKDRTTIRFAEGPRTSRRAEGPRDTTARRETMRCHVVQRDRATSRRTEGPLDTTCCGETARCHLVRRPRDATLCRGTAQCCNVQINRAMPETARCYSVQRKVVKSFCDRDVDRSTTRGFGPASGRTGCSLPIPPDTRRRRTDSEYAECSSIKGSMSKVAKPFICRSH